MHYAGTRHPLARTNPLRSIPFMFMRPASILLRPLAPVPNTAPAPVLTLSTPEQALANAEAHLREIERVYAAARAGIGEANRTTLPDTLPAFIRAQIGAAPVTRLSAERVRERKSAAFRLFNQRRGELARARRAVDAARVALGLPSLAAVAERTATKAAVRASKRQPLHPIAQAAFAV